MTRETTQLVRPAPENKHIERPLPQQNPLSSGYLYDAAPESEHINYIREFVNSVRKHLWLVIGLVVFATAASVVYNSRIPNVYEARAQVRVEQDNNLAKAAFGSSAPVIVNNGIGMDPQYFSTQLQILTGPALMRHVARKMDLEHDPNFLRSTNSNRTTVQSVKQMLGLEKDPDSNKQDKAKADVAPVVATGEKKAPPVTDLSVEDEISEARRLGPYVGMLLGGLKVSQVRDTRIINIAYQHQDPQIAAKVVNNIADVYVRRNLAEKTGSSVREGEFLDERIAQLQREVKSANQQLNNLAKSGDFLEIDKGQDIVVQRLSGLNSGLIQAENARRVAEAQYQVGKEQNVVTAVTSKDSAPLETELNKLTSERARMAEIYTNEWPAMKQLDAQIAEIKKQLEDLKAKSKANNLAVLEARYREALKQEQELKAALAQQKNETQKQNNNAVDYRILQQEVVTKQKLLDDMMERQKQQQVGQQGIANNIFVQEWGLAPNSPVSPKRSQSILLAFIMSIAFGVGLARLLDYLDTTIRTVQDIEKHLRLPVLALIPAVSNWRKLASSTALQRAGGGAEELLIKSDVRSPLAETYRQLRTSILLSTAGRTPKTLLVTSSQASEGKTTNAVNVAHTLTQTGAKVLIIDADMRRPRLHSVFQTDNLQGLSTVLASDLTEAEILEVIVQYGETGIYVLPSGPLPPNPSELLSSESMRRLLGILGDVFTHVVIDSPPITLVTDSVILGSMTDGVLLVVQGDRTSRELVRRSQRLLHEVGARIFGVILNNVNVKPEDYYYYQSYYGSRYYADNAALHTNGNGNGNGNGKN